MTRTEHMLAAVAFLGLSASAGVAALGWLLLTRPVALVQYLQRLL